MNILNVLLEWVYPPRCAICMDIFPINSKLRHFCEPCRETLVFIEKPFCLVCGRSVGREGERCAHCRDKHFVLDRNMSLFVYDDIVADAIHRFKFRGIPDIGRAFGLLMAEALADVYPNGADMIVPIPLHRKRRRERGFNQAVILAEAIEKKTGIPMAEHGVVRKKQTKPQSALNPVERENNLRDAFALGRNFDVNGKTVLLIDDIFTTGSTLDACASLLRAQGAAKVYAFCIASTLQKNKMDIANTIYTG